MKKEQLQSVDEVLEERKERLYRRKEFRRFIVECIVLVALVYAAFHYVIGLAVVSGSSMEPGLTDGEMVLFYRLDETYQRNDLVIIHRADGVEYIKRVVAESGDVVELSEEGSLIVNGEKDTTATAVGKTEALSENITYPYTVPADSYFVLGDNRENSKDSRSFGAVTADDITGRVFVYMGMTR